MHVEYFLCAVLHIYFGFLCVSEMCSMSDGGRRTMKSIKTKNTEIILVKSERSTKSFLFRVINEICVPEKIHSG